MKTVSDTEKLKGRVSQFTLRATDRLCNNQLNTTIIITATQLPEKLCNIKITGTWSEYKFTQRKFSYRKKSTLWQLWNSSSNWLSEGLQWGGGSMKHVETEPKEKKKNRSRGDKFVSGVSRVTDSGNRKSCPRCDKCLNYGAQCGGKFALDVTNA